MHSVLCDGVRFASVKRHTEREKMAAKYCFLKNVKVKGTVQIIETIVKHEPFI
jgi:hypothetical protein